MAVSNLVCKLASFEVGDCFSSYSDLSFRIKALEKASFHILFSKRQYMEHLRQPGKESLSMCKAELIYYRIRTYTRL